MEKKNENDFPSTHHGVEACLQAGELAAKIEERVKTYGDVPLFLLSPGQTLEFPEELLAKIDERAPAPRRHKGKATLTQAPSFIELLNRHKDAGTVVFMDTKACTFLAVLNYHFPGGAGLLMTDAESGTMAESGQRWSDWRAFYACPLSRQWLLWTSMNNQWMSQEAFGQFVEDNLPDIQGPTFPAEGDPEGKVTYPDVPTSAALLEMARKLIIHSKCFFESTLNVTTGDRVASFKQDSVIEGSTKIFPRFLVGIPVFEGGARYAVEARLRVEMKDQKARFGFILLQVDAVREDALNGVRNTIAKETGLPVFAGSPE